MSLNTNYKGKILYGLYNIIWFLVLLPVAGFIFWRYRKYPQHSKRFSERFSLYGNTIEPKKIWVHTASVGEVNTALPFLRQLISMYGINALLITTTTPTGEQVLKKALGKSINHLYLPFDQCMLMKRFFYKRKLQAVILFETEIWPSLITEANNNNVEIILVNARMSENSQRKYVKFSSFTRFVFNQISLVVAQTEKESSHFYDLGAASCKSSDSLKFSISVDEGLREKYLTTKHNWLTSINHKKIIIAASTHPTEESIILEAVSELKKEDISVLLILAPRHIERSDEVEALCLQQNLSVMRYCEKEVPAKNIDIVLVDVVGKLFELFGLASVAIMGGTFIKHGGHNFLEPAAWGLPIVAGKSDYNFSEISKELNARGALTQINDAESLTAILKKLLLDELLAKQQGSAAKEYSLENIDAANKMIIAIAPHLSK